MKIARFIVRFWLAILLGFPGWAAAGDAPGTAAVDLSPARWGDGAIAAAAAVGGRPPIYKQRLPRGVFEDAVLERLREMGQEIVLRPPGDRVGVGFWAGLRIDPESGLIEASASRVGHALGY